MALEKLLELNRNDQIDFLSQNLVERIATKLGRPKSDIPMDIPLQLEENSVYLADPKYKISSLLVEQIGVLVHEWFNREFQIWELLPDTAGKPAFNTIYRAAEHLVVDIETTSVPKTSFDSPYESGIWNWNVIEHTNEIVKNEIVFIVSPPRTGTTLLRLMLEGNPKLFAPPELFLVQFQNMGIRRRYFEQLEYLWMDQGHVDALAFLFSISKEEAQQYVENIARKLEEMGEIILSFPGDNSDTQYV